MELYDKDDLCEKGSICDNGEPQSIIDVEDELDKLEPEN